MLYLFMIYFGILAILKYMFHSFFLKKKKKIGINGFYYNMYKT